MDTRTKSTLTGAGSGAVSGAAAGTAVLPGWGTAIGGVLGGVIGGGAGYFAGEADQKAEDVYGEQLKKLQDFNRNAYAQRQQNLSQIYQMYDPYLQAVNQHTGSNLQTPTAPSGGYFG